MIRVNSDVRSTRGFTLVELLVSMFVLGILLAAVIALSSGYLGFSRRVSVINERLADLNDALGYVGTTARRAMAVVGTDGTSVDIEFAGDTFACSTAVADACVAFVVPIVDRTTASSEITGYDLLAYRVVPFSAWDANPGVPAGWDGDETPLMLEYRSELCVGCTVPPAVGAGVTASRESLVIADLTFGAGAGSFEPFSVANGTVNVTFRMRSQGAGVEAGTLVPADGPLELTVVRRP